MKIVSKKSILRLFSFVVVLFALAPQAVAMPDSVYVCLVNGEVENHSVAAIDSIAFQIFNAIPEKDDSLNVCHKDGKTTSYALYMVDSLAFKKPAAQQSAQWVAVDLGLSVKWCNMNVGASAPEDCGGYYSWGETKQKDYYADSTYLYTDKPYNKNIGKNISGTKYDVAHVKMGGDWRMPTDKEFTELRTRCTWKWTTQNGMEGFVVTGSTGNSIFLPAAGEYFKDKVSGQRRYGYYWIADIVDGTNTKAQSYIFTNGGLYFGSYNNTNSRFQGLSVRPVCP